MSVQQWNKRIQDAVAHLKRADPTMSQLMGDVGPVMLKRKRNRFWMLVGSIVGQQLSPKAASTIRARVEKLVSSEQRSAESLARVSHDDLRAAGLSANKTAYVLELAERVLDGDLKLNTLGRLANEEVIAELTKSRGVGRWTAEMFLIFSLGRLDVFPADDLGVRNAIGEFYGFSETPTREDCIQVAKAWQPFQSVGSWYCWKAIDLKRENDRLKAIIEKQMINRLCKITTNGTG